MASFNQVTFVGNLGKDPELQVTPDGTPVTKFSLAVNEKHKDKESTMWLNVVCWRGLAEVVEKYCVKGAPVLVTGKLSIRDYTDREGIKRTSVEIVASDVRMLGSKSAGAANGGRSPSTEQDAGDPFLPDFPDE